MTEVERFWEKVDKSGDCWDWTTTRSPNGYGQFLSKGKTVRSHRYSWELVNGPIPRGAVIRHRCNRKVCVRPEHLVIGSSRDNNVDAVLSDRHAQALSRSTISALMLAEGSTRDVAERFGVAQKVAWRVMQARTIAERAGWVDAAALAERVRLLEAVAKEARRFSRGCQCGKCFPCQLKRAFAALDAHDKGHVPAYPGPSDHCGYCDGMAIKGETCPKRGGR